MSNSKPQRIKVSFKQTSKGPDATVLQQAEAVDKGLDGNPSFPRLPVTIEELRSGTAKYRELITEALDGSRKVIAARVNQRHEVMGMLRQLASYVEHASAGDMAAFMSSGFEPVAARRPAQAVIPPIIVGVDHGLGGQLLIRISARPRVVHYELRYSTLIGSQAGEWTELFVLKTRPAVSVTGLVPGTIYAFQVRAQDRLSATDWSDSVTKMCI